MNYGMDDTLVASLMIHKSKMGHSFASIPCIAGLGYNKSRHYIHIT